MEAKPDQENSQSKEGEHHGRASGQPETNRRMEDQRQAERSRSRNRLRKTDSGLRPPKSRLHRRRTAAVESPAGFRRRPGLHPDRGRNSGRGARSHTRLRGATRRPPDGQRRRGDRETGNANGHGALRDRGLQRHRKRRLRGEERNGDVRARRDGENRAGAGARRRSRRARGVHEHEALECHRRRDPPRPLGQGSHGASRDGA